MKTPVIVIAPDSYKGSLSALGVARALAAGIEAASSPSECVLAPMADGGEGMLECVAAACGGHWRTTCLQAIHGRPLEGRWYVLDDGTAVIESAQVLGLPLIEATADAPGLRERSSHALGALILVALDAGHLDIVVGLGGSASNDAGLGMLVALGAVARNADGTALAPSMSALAELAALDLSRLDPRLAEARIRVFCDVDNPLLGANGASRVYGPQKGLGEAEIADVEADFERLAALCDSDDAATRPGSGAAGGLGFGLAVLGARLEAGADALMALIGLPDTLARADVVITGEGRSDRQTLYGKLPLAIARAAAPTPAILVAGDIDSAAREALEAHFSICRTLAEQAGSVDAALAEPVRWLEAIGGDLADEITRLAPE